MRRQILLIDVPVVPVNLPAQASCYVQRKLRLEAALRQAMLPGVICPAIPYSRGLLIVAAALIQAKFDVSYVIWSDPKDRHRIKALANSADVVGISCMTSGHDAASQIASFIRSINPNACIVLGGPHATAIGAQLLDEIPALDAVVQGDGHITMVEVAQSAPTLSGIRGVSTRSSPDAVIRLEPYSNTPIPAYQLLLRPLSEYAHSIRTSHGCPYPCAFCAESSTWHTGSFRELESVYAELSSIFSSVRKGTLIHFSDPVFNVNTTRTKALCTWLTKYAPDLFFSMDTRVDLLTEGEVADLRMSGFRYFRVGVESLLIDVLNKTEKGTEPKQVYQALKTIREIAPDSMVHAYWITGLPGSTHDTAVQSMLDAEELIRSRYVDVLSNKVLVPYPGTKYYATPHRFGLRLLNKPWAAYDRLSLPVYDLESVQADEIYQWFCNTEVAVSKALCERLSSAVSSTKLNGIETYKAIAYLDATDKLMST